MKKVLQTLCSLLLLGTGNYAQTITEDTSFDPGIGPSATVEDIVLLDDGKILIGGNFDQYYNGPYLQLRAVRLNTDGSLDNSFSPSGVLGAVNTIAVQSDGKYLFGGNVQRNAWPVNNQGLIRLNPNGSLDNTFDLGGPGFNGTVNALAIQPDGKIVVCGTFTQYNSTPMNNIARLNPDGSLDPGFDPGTGFNVQVKTVVLNPDGKLTVGGFFTQFNGVTRRYIARLNADGSLDTTFDPGNEFSDDVRSIAIQADGKILTGGNLKENHPPGVNRIRIARLNSDGTRDSTFDPGDGFNAYPLSFHIQSNGKILVGGDFATYDGVEARGIARLNPDGSLDASFDLGTGFETNNPGLSFVNVIRVQSDGKIYAGGNFLKFNGNDRNRLVRLIGDQETTSTENQVHSAEFTVYPNPAQQRVSILSDREISSVTITDLSGKVVRHQQLSTTSATLDLSCIANGIYCVRLESEGGVSVKNLIISK